MRSYAVFKKFFEKDVEENGYGIMTSECFLFWVETRNKVPKLPHESFKRAVLAHVRGADNRTPFPSKVERAILCLIRGSFLKGGSAWEAVYATQVPGNKFPKGKCPTSTRQRRIYGFHEKKQSSKGLESLSTVTNDLLTTLLKLQKTDLEKTDKLSTLMSLDMTSLSLRYMMGKLGANDPRLNDDFQMPKPEDRFGRPDLPVYHMVGDNRTMTMIKIPEILGSVPVGELSCEIFARPIDFLACMVIGMPKRGKGEPIWARTRYLVNGEVKVFLQKIVEREGNFSDCYLQDFTDHYKALGDVYTKQN